MKLPSESFVIQVEITNFCSLNCSHCSRLIGHHKKPFFMSMEQIEAAFRSLEDFNGHWGLMGGEPTAHPKFAEICKLLQKYQYVKARRELWTNGYCWDKYKDIIEETFYPELISYNDHSKDQPCWHQPLQIAIDEVFNGSFTIGKFDEAELRRMEDQCLMWKIIDNCWIQQRWSPSVTPMGAYFCETAAARALLFGGPKGIMVEPGWWKKPQTDWEYQRELCKSCSACLPMPMIPNDKQAWDDVSPAMFQKLSKLDSPKCAAGLCHSVDLEGLRAYYRGHIFTPNTEYRERGSFTDFPDWHPWRYRAAEDIKHSPQLNKVEDPITQVGERVVIEGKN